MRAILIVLLVSSAINISAQPFYVGHSTVLLTDTSRNNRSVPLEVYYPVTSKGNTVPAGGKFPLVVFGHGYQLTYSDYLWLADSLVPKGYLLVFPRTEEQLFPSHTDFAKDIAFSVNAFTAASANSASLLYNRLLGKNFVGGHSMGGGCALLSVQYSNSITGVFSFAAAETNPSAIAACAGINLPILFFAGGRDCVSPPQTNQQPMYESTGNFCKVYVLQLKAKHCHWANNSGICTLGEFSCSFNTTPAKPTISQTCALLLPWLTAVSYNSKTAAAQFQNNLITSTDISYLADCKIADRLQ